MANRRKTEDLIFCSYMRLLNLIQSRGGLLLLACVSRRREKQQTCAQLTCNSFRKMSVEVFHLHLFAFVDFPNTHELCKKKSWTVWLAYTIPHAVQCSTYANQMIYCKSSVQYYQFMFNTKVLYFQLGKLIRIIQLTTLFIVNKPSCMCLFAFLLF